MTTPRPTPRWGARWQLEGGLPVAWEDRHGTPLARLRWDGARLVRAEVAGAPGRWLEVDGELLDDPLLGPAHALRVDGREVTRCGAVAWARPTTIPAVAAPAALPPACGTALLGLLAHLAAAAGVPALRYAGRYPTAALWASLRQCFTTSSDEATFTAGALARLADPAPPPVPVDLAPAPFERVWVTPAVAVQLRDAVERVLVDGLAYPAEPVPGSPRRLVATEAGWAAEVWFGDAPWARVAEVGMDGALLAGPAPPPPAASRVVGAAFPAPLRAAIAGLVAELVPAPLAVDAGRVVEARALAWADLGAVAAAPTDEGFAVHAMLWERLAPHGLARVALALAEALAPVVTARLAAALSAG